MGQRALGYPVASNGFGTSTVATARPPHRLVAAPAARAVPATSIPAVSGPVTSGAGVTAASDLWSKLPTSFVEAFRPHFDALVEVVSRDIQAAIPEFSSDGALMRSQIVSGVAKAVGRCLAQIAPGSVAADEEETAEWKEAFREFGRQEYRQGRGLDVLHSAYRIAGRSSWRYVSDVLRTFPVSTDQLCLSAEAIFATVDEIAMASVEGYAEARADGASSRELHRARLLHLLLADIPPAAEAVATLAASAGWEVPERVTVVALEVVEGDAASVHLDDPVLRELSGPRPYLVTGRPEVHLSRLEALLRGRRAAVAPPVPVAEASSAARLARRALDLQDRDILPRTPVLRCAEHLGAMWLTADPFLVQRCADALFAPLGALSPPQRVRMAETLSEWLRHKGNAIDVAAALNIHPQTVRYRMHQLREMFGDRLDDIETRLMMEMALRAVTLLARDEQWASKNPDSAGR